MAVASQFLSCYLSLMISTTLLELSRVRSRACTIGAGVLSSACNLGAIVSSPTVIRGASRGVVEMFSGVAVRCSSPCGGSSRVGNHGISSLIRWRKMSRQDSSCCQMFKWFLVFPK